MTNMKDIARCLVDKHGLKVADAEHFIALMIDVINEGVQRERQVKIKGLGTFKLTSVSSRESVDVNTGERIVIEGRDKISFTPDNAMLLLCQSCRQKLCLWRRIYRKTMCEMLFRNQLFRK